METADTAKSHNRSAAAAQAYPKMAETNQRVEDLLQASEPYNWDELKPSAFCGFARFVLQLVLVGCCGSFLFGFNISLLNTAVRVVCSEFQLCGYRSGFASFLSETIRRGGIQEGIRLCDYNVDAFVASQCKEIKNKSNTTIDYSCPGGYTDLSCSNLKWYIASIQTAVLLGGVAGATTAGSIVKHGRRVLLLVDMAVFCLGVILSLCANSFPAMFVARLIVGYGVGLSSVASPTYISEMTPRLSRGKYGVLHQLMITVGIFLGILLGLPLLDPAEQVISWKPTSFTMFWWRFMLGLGLIPVIIGFYLLYFVYTFDTPIYFVEQHRYQDAYHLLERIHGYQDVKEEFDVCVENVRLGAEYRTKGMTLGSAFSIPEYRFVIIVGLGLAGFQQFGGVNVFVTSSGELFAKAGLSKQMQTGMSIIMALINCVMTFPTIVLIEYLGRKTLLFVCSLLQFISVVPCAISYWLEKDPENPTRATQILAIIAVIGFMVFFAAAFGPIVWVYLFEIFPMEIKDAASSACTSFNWVSAVIMVFVSNLLPNQISFTLFAILQLAATLFVFFFMRETKGLPLGTSPFITKTKAAERSAV